LAPDSPFHPLESLFSVCPSHSSQHYYQEALAVQFDNYLLVEKAMDGLRLAVAM